jgi:hypothetical protein
LGKRRYDNLPEDKLKLERAKRAIHARRWRQTKKDELKELELKLKEVNHKLTQSLVERNRTILYTLPGVGCHNTDCGVCQSRIILPLEKQSSKRLMTYPSLSCIIPLESVAKIDLAIASHLLPPSSGMTIYHKESVVTVDVCFGEAILFYDDLVHRGGESDNSCVRSFATFSEGHKGSLLDNRNYIGSVTECHEKKCSNCDQISRLKHDRKGDILSMRRIADADIGDSVLNSVTLKDFGFVVVKVIDDGYVNEKMSEELFGLSKSGSNFHLIQQEEINMTKEDKKRMILKRSDAGSSATFIRKSYPSIYTFVHDACTALRLFLKIKCDMN